MKRLGRLSCDNCGGRHDVVADDQGILRRVGPCVTRRNKTVLELLDTPEIRTATAAAVEAVVRGKKSKLDRQIALGRFLREAEEEAVVVLEEQAEPQD